MRIFGRERGRRRKSRVSGTLAVGSRLRRGDGAPWEETGAWRAPGAGESCGSRTAFPPRLRPSRLDSLSSALLFFFPAVL